MNEALLQYLLESSIGLVLLYLFFALVLRRETSFQFNRLYLLASLLLAFTVPLTRLPGINVWPAPQEQEMILPALDQTEITDLSIAIAPALEKPTKQFDYWLLLYLAYGVGALFCAVRLLTQLGRLRRFAKQTGPAFYLPENVPVILTHGKLPTFSFWRYVFFDNSQKLTPQETQRILQHEQVHIHQRHSLDILLVSLAGILFWFNPLLVLYKKALEQTHEFIADAHVAKDAGASDYSSLLVKQVLRTSDFPLGSYFFLNQSLTLTRIKMMKKLHQSPRLSRLLLVVPTVAILLVAIAATRPVQAVEPATPEETSQVAAKVKETAAVFPGGPDALSTFVKSNFMLPEVAFQQRKSPNDFVKVTAVVEVAIQKDGTPVYRKTASLDLSPNTPEVKAAVQKQLEKLVQQMPAWAPAQKDGKAVESVETLTVTQVSGNFIGVEGAEASLQQKTKVTTTQAEDPAKESTKEGNTNLIPAIVMVYYPSSQKVATKDLEKKASPVMNMPKRTTNTGEKIYLSTNKLPQFPGGMVAMRKFLERRFRIPLAAQQSQIEGTVMGAFVISATGEVDRVEIAQSLSPSIDQELKRVLNELPAFTPGESEGKQVPVQYLVPIRIVAKRANETAVTKTEITVNGRSSGAPLKEVGKENTITQDSKPVTVTVEEEKVFVAVEQMPSFAGGQEAMYRYMQEAFNLPVDAGNMEGTLVASFVVAANGEVTKPLLLKKLHPSVDKEFLRVLQAMPKWEPGRQNGKAVSVKYTIPFRIEPKK
ncbi:M56 family metallopeptidase [Nibribacter koreensis]|uniref:TonB C-terminal domain-containing protein n=1 Tax=Nibribacter koreensis TaxID=1084519 RepID=A0ABP8FZQ2_9BACT